MMTVQLSRILLFLVFLLLLAEAGFCAKMRGVEFADRVPIAQSEAALVGTALLEWAGFLDIYVGAFYLPDNHPGARWAEDVPKQLELSYFRNFKAKDFSSSSDELLRKTLPPEQYQELAERLSGFYQLFRDVRAGDRYQLRYHPLTGTELLLNGERLGAALGHDFAQAYFGLWLGAEPISKSFRDRLLGS